MGFAQVASGPLVRSSYHAEEYGGPLEMIPVGAKGKGEKATPSDTRKRAE